MVKKTGFSLIELTVVIGLLTLLMLAISGVMLMSIISSNRIRSATKTKQAGSYVINQMQTMIRNARSIESCTAPSTMVINNIDGKSTTFLPESNGSYTRIASNSGTYLTPDYIDAQNLSITCSPATNPNLVELSFDLQSTRAARATENPLLHFETSITLRNQ